MNALLLVLALQGVGLPPEPAPAVARFELAAPERSPSLVRATIPLPDGLDFDPERSPFKVRFPGKDGATVPAQVEVVTRTSTGKPEVIEVLAVGAFAPEVRPNARVSCAVVLGEPEADLAAPEVPANVRELLDPARRGALYLRTRDVFGNLYACELRDAAEATGFVAGTTTKTGRFLRERKLAGVLAPVALPNGAQPLGAPLPHLMGVHAYVREVAGEPCVALDLRIHNGLIAGSREPHAFESPLGIVYWKSLELVVPKGWSVVPDVVDPFFGEAYDEGGARVTPLVKRYENGALHMMGPQCQFERRLVLAPAGEERRARTLARFSGLGFAQRGKDEWSWWNDATARYFPQRERLATPEWYRRGEQGARALSKERAEREYPEVKAALETGTKRGWYVETGVMGWAHPWFLPEQGGVGGEGIALVEGHDVAASASREGYHLLALWHRMNVSRQPEATYDARGEIVGHRRWLDAEGRIPFDYRTHGGVRIAAFLLPMSGGPPASEQVRTVVAKNLRPPYDQGTPFEAGGEIPWSNETLLMWWPHDDQHLVRYTKNAKALVWLGNDSLAKDDLRLSAELFRLMFHESPHVPADWSPGNSLRIWEEIAKAHPHGGIDVGRAHAWGIDAMCAAYALATPEWRARELPWFRRVAKLLATGAMSNGLVQRSRNERFFDVVGKYLGMQTFEHLFLVHAMRCMNEGVFRGVDDAARTELEALVLKGLDTLLFGPPFQSVLAEYQPDPDRPTLYLQGPRQTIAVSLDDERATPPFSDAGRWGPNYAPKDGFGGGVEIVHVWTALAYAESISRESAGRGLANRFLRRALECGGHRATFDELAKALADEAADPWSDNSGNWIGLAGRLQALGVR